MTTERRQAPRVPLKLPVHYRPSGVLSNAWHAGRLEDLSLTGARLTGERLLEVGQTVELRVSTPTRKTPYTLRGVVVSQHVERPQAVWYEHGLQFRALQGREQMDLEELLQFLEHA